MSNIIKKNLITTLNNLLSNSLDNNNTNQIGGRRYSQKEVDNMLTSALSNIMLLYQKSITDKQQIQNQINLIKFNKMNLTQVGGSKHYSRNEVDSMMTSSLQTVLSLYIQSENERQLLANELSQLQIGSGISPAKISILSASTPVPVSATPAPIYKNVSIGAVQEYIDGLTGGSSPNYNKQLQLLIVKNLNDVDPLMAGINNSSSYNSNSVTLNFKDTNKKNIDIYKIFVNDEDGSTTKQLLDSKISTITGFNVAINNKKGIFGLKDGAKQLFENKITFNLANPTDVINLDDDNEFQNKINFTLKNSASETASKFVRQHLKENVKPDLP
jgi:hypothetical protein